MTGDCRLNKQIEIFHIVIMLNIRKGEKKDLQHIHKLVLELAEFEGAPEQFTASLDDYSRDFEKGWFEVNIAEWDGEIVGMTMYFETYSSWRGRMMYLDDFIVKAEFRNLGIGQALFETFLQEARERQCKMVKWEVLDWNRDAIRFYQINNAIIEKEWLNGKIIF